MYVCMCVFGGGVRAVPLSIMSCSGLFFNVSYTLLSKKDMADQTSVNFSIHPSVCYHSLSP